MITDPGDFMKRTAEDLERFREKVFASLMSPDLYRDESED